MDIERAFELRGAAAPYREIAKYGISRAELLASVREERIIRIRHGWYALPTITPAEYAAIEQRSFLTCASAAAIRQLPVARTHFHVRAREVGDSRVGTVRRGSFRHHGALVGVSEMIVDYLSCQDPAWSQALVDTLTSRNELAAHEWEVIAGMLPRALSKIVDSRSSIPESPLESITRFQLERSKIKHWMQVPIGRFRADFVIGPGVVLEVHGAEYHASRADWEADRRRVAWLKGEGWDVIELTYQQVMDWDEALVAIRATLARRKGRRK